MTEVRGDHQISSLNRMTKFIDGLNQVVVHNLNRRPFEFLITTLLGTIILVNAWTLVPRSHVEIPLDVRSHPEYWSFLFVVFAPYLFGTCLLAVSFWYAILGDIWWMGQGIRPLLELSPVMFLPLIIGCLISVFPDEIRLPLIQSKIWWPATLLTGVTVTFAIFIWNRRSASLRKNTLTRDVAQELASERTRPKIQKTAKETPENGSILQAIQPEMESHPIQRALVSVVCLSLCAGCYFLGQIFSHFYFYYAPFNLIVEIVLIESFKVCIKLVTFINITISDVFLGSEVFSAIAYYFGELAFYIFYRNLFTSKMNSAWTVVGLCALNAGMYGLLPVTYMSRWGYRNLQILRILKIRTTVDENKYPAYVLIVARKMVVNALATVVSMVSFFVWSLGTRYISNERDFMTYGRTHQDDEAFLTVLNKQAGALASEVFAIGLGFWWAKRYHNCNPIREFTDWMIKNPSFYYCFVTTTCHVLGDLVIALISINFV